MREREDGPRRQGTSKRLPGAILSEGHHEAAMATSPGRQDRETVLPGGVETTGVSGRTGFRGSGAQDGMTRWIAAGTVGKLFGPPQKEAVAARGFTAYDAAFLRTILDN